MWEDEILDEIHRIREQHVKSLNYDLKAICEDWHCWVMLYWILRQFPI